MFTRVHQAKIGSRFISMIYSFEKSTIESLTGSSVGLGPCLTKGGGPRFEPPEGTLGNSPVYWRGLPCRFSGAPRGLWGCVSGPITPWLSKRNKNQPLVHGRPSFRRDLKQTVEHKLPFIFQNDRLSSGSRGDFKTIG